LSRWLYSLLLYCALPFAAAWFLWKGWRHPAYRGSLRERLGFGLAQLVDAPIWLHAASVGEVRSLNVLLRLLHRQGFALLLSVGTQTGLAQARRLYADLPELTVRAAPWDLPGAVRRFLRASRPQVGVFVETELWPNLVAGARAAGVPLGLVSARLSEKSTRRYRRWAPRLMREIVRAFTQIGAQTREDQDRFVSLGAHKEAVTVSGSLKFELQLPPEVCKLGAAWRAHWAPARPLWVAGSTHAGEETACLAAQRRLRGTALAQGKAPPLLVLAPRHLERLAEVVRELEMQEIPFARSSQPPAAGTGGVQVVLVDAMGELVAWYAAADAAFVGGSLVEVGGHNLLEPAMLGKPVLAGPHSFNAPEVTKRLREAGGLITVRDEATLATELGVLFGDASVARERGARAYRGALPQELGSLKAVQLISTLLARRQR
jgi:3-deoxy-D-manno-octulosonic-acid transferase